MTVLEYPAGTANRNLEQTSAAPPNVAVSVSSKGYYTTSICFRSAVCVLWIPTIPT